MEGKMTVDIDKTVELNREMLDLGHEILHRPFLGPRGIARVAQMIIRASAHYNGICMALLGMAGGERDDPGSHT